MEAGNRAAQGGDAEDVLAQVAAWMEAGMSVALATVVSTWGSSPRPAGSQLAVNEQGAFVGSVSGGCIEGAVVKEALAVMDEAGAGGGPRLLAFGVSNESAWEVGLACGGKVRVLVERVGGADGMTRDLLDALLADRAAKRPVVLATWLAPEGLPEEIPDALPDVPGAAPSAAPAGSRIVRHQRAHPFDAAPAGDAHAPAPALVAAARTAAIRDRPGMVELDGAEVFLRVYNPPLRLAVVGAVHIAQALCPMAALAGFAVTVVDPRAAFATPARFPGVTLCTDWPDEALQGLVLDRRCAVVTLTHDPKLDEPALRAALGSEAFYIGALGSKKTQAARLGRLRAQGMDDQALARINGPVGLAIGARSAAEIAVSILAQIIEALRFEEP